MLAGIGRIGNIGGLGGSNPFTWANAVAPAHAAFDFQNDRAIWDSARVANLAAVPNWTFTRASTGYALDLAGNLVPFASGALRRTDRGVLIEGARTNVLLYSQDYSSASYWGTTNTALTTGQTAPDGTSTATLITISSTAGTTTSAGASNWPAVTGTNCVGSVYVKRGANVEATANFNLRDQTAAANKVSGVLTWATMTMTGTGASIERLGATDWYRITLIDTAWTSGNTARLYIGAAGGTFTAGHSWYIWGAQLEAASFASSYIPTTTASVTRAADALSITGVSGITYPMTLFAEVEAGLSGTITGAPFVPVQIGDGTTSNRTALHFYEHGASAIIVVNGGVTQADRGVVGVLTRGTIIRCAGRAATNSVQMAKNGTLASEDTSATMPTALGTVSFASSALGQLFGYLRRAAIWTSAFTDAQLQTQTS